MAMQTWINPKQLRATECIGRPLGNDRFLARIERLTGRALKGRAVAASFGGRKKGPRSTFEAILPLARTSWP
jgi:hypothetical protein